MTIDNIPVLGPLTEKDVEREKLEGRYVGYETAMEARARLKIDDIWPEGTAGYLRREMIFREKMRTCSPESIKLFILDAVEWRRIQHYSPSFSIKWFTMLKHIPLELIPQKYRWLVPRHDNWEIELLNQAAELNAKTGASATKIIND